MCDFLTKVMFSPPEALALVSPFFEEEWPQTKEHEVSVKRIVGGISSQVHVVRRSSPAVKEPAAVIVRHKTGNFTAQKDMIVLSDNEFHVMFYEMSRSGWGPQMYGITDSMRIEEYVDSHTLTPTECQDELIVRDIARSFVHIHTMKVPLIRGKRDRYVLYLRQQVDELRARGAEIRSQLQQIDVSDPIAIADKFFSADFDRLFQQLDFWTKKFNCKKALEHGDSNLMNILVLNDKTSERRVMHIDFEIMMYGYRGYDIGSHFVNRMLDWGDNENKFCGKAFPDVQERRKFCQAYIDALAEAGHTLTGEDTADHLIVEADIGALYYLCWIGVIIMKSIGALRHSPAFIRAVPVFIDMIIVREAEFRKANGL